MSDKPNTERPQRIELPKTGLDMQQRIADILLSPKHWSVAGSWQEWSQKLVEIGDLCNDVFDAHYKETAAAMAPQAADVKLALTRIKNGMQVSGWPTPLKLSTPERTLEHYQEQVEKAIVLFGKIADTGLEALAASPAAQHEAMATAGVQSDADLLDSLQPLIDLWRTSQISHQQYQREGIALIAQATRKAELRGIKAAQLAGDRIADKLWREHLGVAARKAINAYRVAIRALNPETILEGK